MNGLEIELSEICEMGLTFCTDGFRISYVVMAIFMWSLTTLLAIEYMKHHKDKMRFFVFTGLTFLATVGVFLSADLWTLFLFFEVMSFTSYVWVAQEDHEEAYQAAATYLTVAVLGGMVMLMGLFLLYHNVHTLKIVELKEAVAACTNQKQINAAGLCILFGFGAKAGAFPLHIWLPKAHPVAPAPASALLSGILTKTGVFGTLIMAVTVLDGSSSFGKLLLVLGTITMVGGALLALFSVDFKRTLACSSMSQIGFILVGVGMMILLSHERAIAAHGVALHMLNHSLIKTDLFMVAGVIYMNTHALDLNTIQGFGKKRPLLACIFLVGALSIAGIPCFSGYISKTLLHESILLGENISWLKAVEMLFLFSGGITLAYMTKLFVVVFVEKNRDLERQAAYDEKKAVMNPLSAFALTVSAVVLFIFGAMPYRLMDSLAGFMQGFLGVSAFGEHISYFAFENLKGALVTLLVGSTVYFGFVRTVLWTKREGYVNRLPKWLDLETLLYRPILFGILPVFFGILCRIGDCFIDSIVVGVRKTLLRDASLPNPHRYSDWLENRYFEVMEGGKVITRSLSFGLFLFGIGFIATLVYILFF